MRLKNIEINRLREQYIQTIELVLGQRIGSPEQIRDFAESSFLTFGGVVPLLKAQVKLENARNFIKLLKKVKRKSKLNTKDLLGIKESFNVGVDNEPIYFLEEFHRLKSCLEKNEPAEKVKFRFEKCLDNLPIKIRKYGLDKPGTKNHAAKEFCIRLAKEYFYYFQTPPTTEINKGKRTKNNSLRLSPFDWVCKAACDFINAEMKDRKSSLRIAIGTDTKKMVIKMTNFSEKYNSRINIFNGTRKTR